jgi:hypothetical protein
MSTSGRRSTKRKEGIMSRNLKALGLALVAVFALSALAASSASAIDKFTTGSTAVVTGTSHDNVFRTTSPVFEATCTTSSFSGTVGFGATEITIDATYTGTINQTSGTHEHCTATTPASKTTVSMEGCDYDLTGSTTGSDGGKTDATVWVTCPAGKEIKMTTNSGCNFKVPGQTSTSGGVTYVNEPGGKVKAVMTSTGVTYTTEGALCALAGFPSEGNNADYIGTVVLSGFQDNGGNTEPFTEGNAVVIEVS